MTKKYMLSLALEAQRELKKSEDTLEYECGSRVSSCSLSYDVGYWQGRLDLLKALTLSKKLRGEK
jgi:hypothetical protein